MRKVNLWNEAVNDLFGFIIIILILDNGKGLYFYVFFATCA
jgi:hypothetical protein